VGYTPSSDACSIELIGFDRTEFISHRRTSTDILRSRILYRQLHQPLAYERIKFVLDNFNLCNQLRPYIC
jgi:hypothetical protein